MTMKLNKSKGKVHPSPSSSSSSSSSSSFSVSSSCHSQVDPVSSLNLLLPAAILTLISVLSLPDREVLAYMITRSLKSPLTLEEIPNSNSNSNSTNNRKKSKPKKSNSNPTHKSPTFDCDCFQCYTTYWFRWDSSPHRELIHQAIEAFEEHLATAERTATSAAGKPSRRRDKLHAPPPPPPTTKTSPAFVEEKGVVAVVAEPELGSQENENVLEAGSPESVAGEESTATATENEVALEEEKEQKLQREEQQQQQQHKGLARKMLPDVIGLFNSRLWNLWGPNV